MLAQPYPRLSHHHTIVWQARGVELVAGVRCGCVCGCLGWCHGCSIKAVSMLAQQYPWLLHRSMTARKARGVWGWWLVWDVCVAIVVGVRAVAQKQVYMLAQPQAVLLHWQ